MDEKTGTSWSRARRKEICSERARCGLLAYRTEDLSVTGKREADLPQKGNHDTWLTGSCPLPTLASAAGSQLPVTR